MNGSASACASVARSPRDPPPSPAPAVPAPRSFRRVTNQMGNRSCWRVKSSDHGNAGPSRWRRSCFQGNKQVYTE